MMIEPGPVSNLGRLGKESWNKLLSQRSSWLSIPPYMCILLQSMRDWNANTLDWKALDRAFQSRIFMWNLLQSVCDLTANMLDWKALD